MSKERKKPYSPVQMEALRLMNEKGTIGRHMAAMVGIQHQAYSDIKIGQKPFSNAQARRIIKAFEQFANAVTPRVNDTDAD